MARCKNIDFSLEYNLVNSFLSYEPSAFKDYDNDFDILAKMQHYGIPTRLLDFTTNPLIALYFACTDLINEENARVVCYDAHLNIARNVLIESICGLYKNRFVSELFVESIGVNPYYYLVQLYLINYKGLLVTRPKYWNDRLKRQSGVFIVFTNEL